MSLLEKIATEMQAKLNEANDLFSGTAQKDRETVIALRAQLALLIDCLEDIDRQRIGVPGFVVRANRIAEANRVLAETADCQ